MERVLVAGPALSDAHADRLMNAGYDVIVEMIFATAARLS